MPHVDNDQRRNRSVDTRCSGMTSTAEQAVLQQSRHHHQGKMSYQQPCQEVSQPGSSTNDVGHHDPRLQPSSSTMISNSLGQHPRETHAKHVHYQSSHHKQCKHPSSGHECHSRSHHNCRHGTPVPGVTVIASKVSTSVGSTLVSASSAIHANGASCFPTSSSVIQSHQHQQKQQQLHVIRKRQYRVGLNLFNRGPPEVIILFRK